jgi:hypothetical protein
MPIITEQIGTQGFELVGNRIGEILLEEVLNQKEIQSFEDNVEIYLELQEPFDKSQDVVISVDYKLSEYEGYTTRDSQGKCLYYVDIWTCGYGIGDTPASIVAKDKLFRYLGIVRYVLSSSKYLTLGFPAGLIGGKYIEKIIVDNDYSNHERHSNQDGSYIRFARVLFSVRVQENQNLWDSVVLQGNNTKITYNNTPKGTQLIINN